MFCFWLIFKKGKKNLILNIVIEKQQGEGAFIENAFKNLLRTFFFFYQRCWSILYSFSELMHSDQILEYKRLNFSANYMPEGTLTMQVSMLF